MSARRNRPVTPHILSKRAEVRAIRGIHEIDMTPQARRDAERLLREVPPDTRGRTAKLMGDPIPQRSALAQRRQG